MHECNPQNHTPSRILAAIVGAHKRGAFFHNELMNAHHGEFATTGSAGSYTEDLAIMGRAYAAAVTEMAQPGFYDKDFGSPMQRDDASIGEAAIIEMVRLVFSKERGRCSGARRARSAAKLVARLLADRPGDRTPREVRAALRMEAARLMLETPSYGPGVAREAVSLCVRGNPRRRHFAEGAVSALVSRGAAERANDVAFLAMVLVNLANAERGSDIGSMAVAS